ncbi:hypothetical protein [Methanosarcina sp. WWM596]|nr:hypothetical protein [Methanosarcina sp. WWM596]
MEIHHTEIIRERYCQRKINSYRLWVRIKARTFTLIKKDFGTLEAAGQF